MSTKHVAYSVTNARARKTAVDLSELISAQRDDTTKNSFTERNQGRILEYYLVGEINEPSEYVEWFDQIRHAAPNDLIKIYINSPGGDLFTAIQFMRVLRECQGSVIASIEGCCCSAATIVFLGCDNYEISAHSNFMFHNYSGVAVGKGGEMKDQLAFEAKWSEHLMRDVYVDFLTEQEICAMLDGKDIWMNAQQVVDRLNLRTEKRKNAEADKPKS